MNHQVVSPPLVSRKELRSDGRFGDFFLKAPFQKGKDHRAEFQDSAPNRFHLQQGYLVTFHRINTQRISLYI